MDNIIIGNGFSAKILEIYLRSKNSNVKIVKIGIGAKPFNILESVNRIVRRKNLEINKFFKPHSQSLGSLLWDIPKGIVHDRLLESGNSMIWGGFIDISGLSFETLSLMRGNGIHISDISFRTTGSESKCESIKQLHNSTGHIYAATSSATLTSNNKNICGYVTRIGKNSSNSLFVEYLSIDNNCINNHYKILSCKKLYLCIGVAQLIDLMFRSNIIRESDLFTMDEFIQTRKFYFFIFLKNKYANNFRVITYNIFGIIQHALALKIFSFFHEASFFPFYMDQIFHYQRQSATFTIEGNTVKPTSILDKKFGKSIHYCNLKVNNIPVRDLLSRISPNLNGFGMAFLNQIEPGPISNDIIKDILKKCE